MHNDRLSLEAIARHVDAKAEDYCDLSDRIWAAPELAFEETKTAALVAKELKDLGYETHTGIGKTGVVGILKNGPGPVVMFRGDMDALRGVMANGLRQILLLLIPSAVIMAVLAVPITRLVYQRGEFDAAATSLVSDAMFWWAFSLPAQGASLLLSRTFFALQRPWVTTALSGANLVINAAVSLALYKPFGISGIVIGTVVGMFIPTVLQNGFIVTNVEPFWQEVAIGFILIAAVYIDQLKRRSRERA